MSDPSAASLLPVIITLIVALTARNVLVGLFSGVLVGVAMLADVTPILFVPSLVKDFIVPEIANSYNASVLVLLVFIGGFVKLIEYSGSGLAIDTVINEKPAATDITAGGPGYGQGKCCGDSSVCCVAAFLLLPQAA